MTDYRDVLERVGDRAPMPEPAFERILRRRDQKRRNQRISAGVVGIAVSVALVLALVNVSAERGSRPLTEPPPLPANGWIVYAAEVESAIGDGFDIYLVDDGVATRRIIGSDDDGLSQECPTFSPDGSMLAYTEYAKPQGPPRTVTLVVTALDGFGEPTGEEQRIVVPSVQEPNLVCAEWSPDGRRLAYAANDSGLWVAGIDSQTPDLLVESELFGSVHDFEWSPNGSTIAVSVLDGEIWLVSVDGKDMRVVSGGMNGGTLAWSPEGTRLAVGRDGSWGGARNPGIRVIDVDRNDVRTLALGDDPTMGGNPVWSPDGEHIAFVKGVRIVVTDPDAGGAVILPPLVLPGISKRHLGIWEVKWSPDGQRLLSIASVRKPDVTYAVISLDADGASPAVRVSPLTFGLYNTHLSDLDWQPVP